MTKTRAVRVRDLQGELAAVREAAALAYQALLWRGPDHDATTSRQVEAAFKAIKDLGIAPLFAHWAMDSGKPTEETDR